MGVRAVVGGVHPGVGTRNALLSLDGAQYLEMIAPDPEQATFNFPIDLSSMAEPRLVTWAVRTSDIRQAERRAEAAGFESLVFRDGARRTPDGRELAWKTLRIGNAFGSAGVELLPFFIEWGRDSVHPATSSPKGCTLQSLRFAHPDPVAFSEASNSLGIVSEIAEGEARIVASVLTPNGTIEIS